MQVKTKLSMFNAIASDGRMETILRLDDMVQGEAFVVTRALAENLLGLIAEAEERNRRCEIKTSGIV